MRRARSLLGLALIALYVYAPASAQAVNCAGTSIGATPLNDLGTGTYKGSQGGLYPDSANQPPKAHLDAGTSLGRAIGPMDQSGTLDPSGKYVFMSIGLSNTTQEFSTFKPLADADPDRDKRLVIVDGAQGSQTAVIWANPQANTWAVADQRLAGAGVSPKQVAVVWIKLADAGPTTGWPAYAQTLQSELASIVRNVKDRYPNVQLAYLSSRIYAGYADTPLNPEPYAYESGFSVKWLIGDQVGGSQALNFDPGKGAVEAPWLAWGPYLWADGTTPRSDGLTWPCSDLSADGTHPSPAGRNKVAQMLLSFVKSDPTATEWFLRDIRAPGEHVHARKRQKLRRLKVRDTLDEPGTIAAGGRIAIAGAKRAPSLLPVSTSVAGNEKAKLRLKVKRGRGTIRHALHRGGRVHAVVKLAATDYDGNSSAKTKRIRIRG